MLEEGIPWLDIYVEIRVAPIVFCWVLPTRLAISTTLRGFVVGQMIVACDARQSKMKNSTMPKQEEEDEITWPRQTLYCIVKRNSWHLAKMILLWRRPSSSGWDAPTAQKMLCLLGTLCWLVAAKNPEETHFFPLCYLSLSSPHDASAIQLSRAKTNSHTKEMKFDAAELSWETNNPTNNVFSSPFGTGHGDVDHYSG